MTDETKFKCKKCSRKFKSAAGLKLHAARTHDGSDPTKTNETVKQGLRDLARREAGLPSGLTPATNETGKGEPVLVSCNVRVEPPEGGRAGHLFCGGTRYEAREYPNGSVLRTRHPNGKGGWVSGEGHEFLPDTA